LFSAFAVVKLAVALALAKLAFEKLASGKIGVANEKLVARLVARFAFATGKLAVASTFGRFTLVRIVPVMSIV